jgi:hypothetical protein
MAAVPAITSRPPDRALTAIAAPCRVTCLSGPHSTAVTMPPTPTAAVNSPSVRGSPPNRSALSGSRAPANAVPGRGRGARRGPPPRPAAGRLHPDHPRHRAWPPSPLPYPRPPATTTPATTSPPETPGSYSPAERRAWTTSAPSSSGPPPGLPPSTRARPGRGSNPGEPLKLRTALSSAAVAVAVVSLAGCGSYGESHDHNAASPRTRRTCGRTGTGSTPRTTTARSSPRASAPRASTTRSPTTAASMSCRTTRPAPPAK